MARQAHLQAWFVSVDACFGCTPKTGGWDATSQSGKARCVCVRTCTRQTDRKRGWKKWKNMYSTRTLSCEWKAARLALPPKLAHSPHGAAEPHARAQLIVSLMYKQGSCPASGSLLALFPCLAHSHCSLGCDCCRLLRRVLASSLPQLDQLGEQKSQGCKRERGCASCQLGGPWQGQRAPAQQAQRGRQLRQQPARRRQLNGGWVAVVGRADVQHASRITLQNLARSCAPNQAPTATLPSAPTRTWPPRAPQQPGCRQTARRQW